MIRLPNGLTIKRVNTVLFALIVVINLYVISAPLLPQVEYWWHSNHSNRQQQLTTLINKPSQIARTDNKPQGNSLIIPVMMLNQPTLEGPASNWFNLLKEGVWRWPDSSTPDKGGNTVFLAHRFSYTGPHGAFYYLNKLKTGDEIGVVWNSKTYHYRVASVTEVPPTQTSIEDNTSDSRITLFTCTPLWHPVNRLVIVAEQEGGTT